jgi:type II secretory pathway pseudopilin PulG
MGTHKLAGFTIIETMLFLGISGALVVGLIASSGASLNTQRYRDAAESFKTTLQQQYSDLISVQNSRDDSWSCGPSATPTNTGSVRENRGQSDCSLLGKYVRLEDEKISIYKVVGYETDSTSPTNDIDQLKSNYVLNIVRDEVESNTLEWGAFIAYPSIVNNTPNPTPQSPRKMGILIVRSPNSGQIYTFSNAANDVPLDADITSTTLNNMLVAGDSIPGQGAQLICVNSGGFLANNDRAVMIDKFATGASAVELQTNDFLTSRGTNTQC